MAAADEVLSIEGLVDPVEVGRGGFAVVYRAHQPAFDRTVAVKILNSAPDETSLERFQREVRAMGKLSEHPSIATVLDAGVTSSGQPFLLMPFFSGGSLQSKLLDGGTFTPADTIMIGIRLASALAAAHAEGILHRDVKPANVMLGRYGDPLLVDFGIARIAGGHETTTGVVTATLSHAAPELLDGKPPSVATDVYALGSTLFTLLTGRPPFSSTTDQSVVPLIARIMSEPLPPLPAGVPPALAAVLARATAKDAADRFPDAAAMGRALEAARTGEATSDVAPPPAPAPAPVEPAPPAVPDDVSGPTRTLASTPDAPREPSTGSSHLSATTGTQGPARSVLIGGALVVLLVVVGAFVALTGGGDDPPAEGDGGDEVVATDDTVDDTGGGPDLGEDELDLLTTEPTDRAAIEPGTVLEIGVTAGQVSALTFDVPEAGMAVRVSTAPNEEVDPIGVLFRGGDVVAVGGRGSGSVVLEVPELEPGEHEVRFAGLSGQSGSVAVSVELAPIQQAVEGAGGELAGHELDVYRVEVRPGLGRGVAVTTDGEIELRAIDATAGLVDIFIGRGVLTMDLSANEPGTYYVFVGPGGLGFASSYTLAPLGPVGPAEREPPQGPIAPGLQFQDGLPAPADVTTEIDPSLPAFRIDLGEVVGLPFSNDEEGALIRAALRSPDGALDPVLLLYRADGTLLAASDDEGFGFAGQDALIDFPLPAGDYVLVAHDLEIDEEGPVEFRFALVTGTPLRPGPAALERPDDPVVYLLQVAPGAPPPATVRVQADIEALVRVIGADGAIIATTDGGGNPPVPLVGLGEGTYYVVISSGEPGDILLTVGG